MKKQTTAPELHKNKFWSIIHKHTIQNNKKGTFINYKDIIKIKKS